MTGVDLRAADLTKANLCEANLSGVDLRRATLLRATLHGANLRHVRYTSTSPGADQISWPNSAIDLAREEAE